MLEKNTLSGRKWNKLMKLDFIKMCYFQMLYAWYSKITHFLWLLYGWIVVHPVSRYYISLGDSW